MVIQAIYLAPGTSQTLNKGFLPHIQDVKKIKEMNWCDFAVQYLMKGINKFRSNMDTNINLQGCVHILLLFDTSPGKAFSRITLRQQSMNLPNNCCTSYYPPRETCPKCRMSTFRI